MKELQLRKKLLVLECDLRRTMLHQQCQPLQSPGWWAAEGGRAVQRHPLVAAGLGVSAGLLAFKTVRHPRQSLSLIGRMVRLAYAAPVVMKLLRRFRGT